MDEQTFRILEFERILEMAAIFAVTAPGKVIVQTVRPRSDIAEIRTRINLVSECRRLLSEGRSVGIEHFEDLSHLFNRIRPADAVLDPVELRSFLPLLLSAFNLKGLINDPLCPGLGMIASRLTTHPQLRKVIEDSVDREGKIRDEASPELSRIRKSIGSFESRIKALLDGILKREDLVPHLQDFYITQRNNRWVIPVKRDAKGNVPGVVHDISNTGETVFVEPYTIQQTGNELESLRAEEKLEEYRILRKLTALLRKHLSELEEDYSITAEIDSLQAMAGFAEQLQMSPPEINQKNYMKITSGFHPLLWKSLKKAEREADLVPLDLEIGRGHSGIVITGSNTGGKTVALKTIGVLNLMALSGMHITAESGTTIPLLKRLYADIGDEQSIDRNLSTFSAHIKRISDIIRHSSADTLVIIDELGTGTDPEQGGAISCAVLKRLKQSRAMTVISTHLGMLKSFAHAEPGMMNCAMEMKEVQINGISSHRPTYKLVIGEPGTSHAFEIAEALGLDKDVIKEAKGFMTGQGPAMESLIAELKEKTAELERRLQETETLKQEAARLQMHLKDEISKISAGKQEVRAKALKEAEELMRQTKREAWNIIETLKKSSLIESRKTAKEIESKISQLETARKESLPEQIRLLKEAEKGQRVFITTLRTHGIIQSVSQKNRKCLVLADGKEITVPFSALSEPVKGPHETARGKQSLPLSEIDTELPRELNIIGLRVDPAISLIERYLNDASLAGLGEIKIIHGIGTGILAQAVRDYVKDHPLVQASRPGNEDEGGAAVTIVFL